MRAAGLNARLRVEGDPVPLAPVAQLTVYRIVQEALTNVTRHAGACTIQVGTAVTDGALTVEVIDDGVGGEGRAGNGITGMRERASALGGTLDAGPVPGGGFRVRATLPIGPA